VGRGFEGQPGRGPRHDCFSCTAAPPIMLLDTSAHNLAYPHPHTLTPTPHTLSSPTFLHRRKLSMQPGSATAAWEPLLAWPTRGHWRGCQATQWLPWLQLPACTALARLVAWEACWAARAACQLACRVT
jgi:hypothetical protein